MKDHHDAVKDLQERQRRVAEITEGLPNAIASAVAGHVGDSTVTVSSGGDRVHVEVTGPDAAEHRADVHRRAAQAVIEHVKGKRQ